MVGKVIRDYMEGGAKKLTVPGFGTFMRRGSGDTHGEIIFVDLLRGDDKTLSEMVEDRGGYSEVEAMALIDRFIFETKTTIERHGSAAIEGFGTMALDHKGVYQFSHSPKSRPVKEHAVQERLFEETPMPAAARTADRHASIESKPRPAKSRSQRPVPRQRSQGRGPQRKLSRTDTIVVIAIIAAAIALIAMVFGLTTGGGNMPFLQK